MEQGRGHHGKDYLSFNENPIIRSLMGRRTNGLPLLFLVPDSIVEDHRLRRLQHHTLTPYSDAEGIRLLKEMWSGIGKSGAYVTALDECYTVALLNGGPQKYLRDNLFLRKTADGKLFDGDAFATEYARTHRNNCFWDQHTRVGMKLDLEAKAVGISKASKLIDQRRPPVARSAEKEHACLKAVYDVGGFEHVNEDEDLYHMWFHNPVPEFIAPHAVGSGMAAKEQHAFVSTAPSSKKVDCPKTTVCLLGSGLASQLFFDNLDINVTVAIEPKADLQRLAKDRSPSTQVFDDVRKVVHRLEDGQLSKDSIWAEMVETNCRAMLKHLLLFITIERHLMRMLICS